MDSEAERASAAQEKAGDAFASPAHALYPKSDENIIADEYINKACESARKM